jgi:hypothetical protein
MNSKIHYLKTEGLANLFSIYNGEQFDLISDYCKAVAKAEKVLNGIENKELFSDVSRDIKKVDKAWDRIIPVRRKIKSLALENKSLFETFEAIEFVLFTLHCFINDEGDCFMSFEEWMILSGFQSSIG